MYVHERFVATRRLLSLSWVCVCVCALLCGMLLVALRYGALAVLVCVPWSPGLVWRTTPLTVLDYV